MPTTSTTNFDEYVLEDIKEYLDAVPSDSTFDTSVWFDKIALINNNKDEMKSYFERHENVCLIVGEDESNVRQAANEKTMYFADWAFTIIINCNNVKQFDKNRTNAYLLSEYVRKRLLGYHTGDVAMNPIKYNGKTPSFDSLGFGIELRFVCEIKRSY